MTQPNAQLKKIKNAAGSLYDLQKLRIQSGNRATSIKADLDEKDVAFLAAMSTGLDQVEHIAEKELKRHLRGYPIYETWLKKQSGVGTKMSGVIISSINIHKCETVSQMWAYCGLSVVNGHSQRRVRGQKANYNTWLRAKMVKVLGDNLIRFSKLGDDGQYLRSTAKVPTVIPKEQAWRRFYDYYKVRKQNTIVPVCMGCDGTGKVKRKTKDEEGETEAKVVPEKAKEVIVVCPNCEGTGGPAPWGQSDGHRHNAARRYLVKMFLQELWLQWRTLEGLKINVSYEEAKLGVVHGDHSDLRNIGPKAALDVTNAAE